MFSRVRFYCFAAIGAVAWGVLTGPAFAGEGQKATENADQVVTLRSLHNATSVSVMEYGALGDCTVSGEKSGCTDNSTAIQNAIDHCYTAGCSVYFPANPAGQGKTVYYTSRTINPKGVTMIGPPGGASAAHFNTPQVAVRGAPGKDVFATGDPSNSGYVKPLKRFSVRDLTIVVDDSTDASSSFPNRLPGRTVFDAAMTVGSADLSSNTALFQPGDVGQSVLVYGAGPAGANLDTTVSSWTSPKQVTLATPTATPVTGAHVYISVMGLATSQTIGNCAWAYDATSFPGSYNGAGAQSEDFTNVNISTTDNRSLVNHVCGYFFQGGAATYQGRWEHDSINAEFGFAFVPSNGIPPGPLQCTGICDFNVFDHTWISSVYPFIAYGGNDNTIRDVQMSTVEWGPHILSAHSASPDPWSWHIDIPEMENPADQCSNGWIAFRISGRGHIVDRLGTPKCKTGSMAFQWDASYSTVTELRMTSLKPINITGNSNTISAPYILPGYGAPDVTGFGNQLITCGSMNPFDRFQAAGCQYAGLNPATVGPPLLSRGKTTFNRTHDFIDTGAGDYYLNGEDLWLWPGEMGGWGGLQGTPRIVFDTASETGSALDFPSGSNQAYLFYESNGTRWTIGSQIPAGRMRIYFNARAASNGTQFDVDATYNSASGTSVSGTPAGGAPATGKPVTSLHCARTLTLSTSYAVYSCDVDSSGLEGDSFAIKLGGKPLTSNVQVAWVALRPWNTDLTATSATFGEGGTPMKGSAGDGGYAQETTSANKTPGDLVAFDRNGNTVDSGIPSSRLGGKSSAQAEPVTPAGGDRGSSVSGASNSQEVASVDPNPGDLLCAHAADTTIHAIPITGGKCDGATCTLEGTSIPADYLIPGQIVGVSGTSGVAGLNGGPYTLKSGKSSSIVFDFGPASGNLSGGTFFRYCENQSADATSFTRFSKNSLAVAANSLVTDTNYTHRAYMLLTTSTTAPGFGIQMTYGSTFLYSGPALNLDINQSNTPAQLATNLLPLTVGSSGLISSSLQSLTLSGSNSNYGSTAPGIAQIDTASSQTIGVNAMFTASGVASIGWGTGGTIAGAGTCILTGFNGGGNGARATVTFTTNGNWSGATFGVNHTGNGYSSAPTSATLLNGTAKCSGTATLTTVLGGAEGNAVELVGLQ